VVERLLLIGMMGAGKSTVGPLVARSLGWSFTDTDEEVERITGQPVLELFVSGGEALFREEESRALVAALTGSSAVVVSVGGGAVVDLANRVILRRAGLVVWLRARPETLAERVGDGAGRPLLAGVGAHGPGGDRGAGTRGGPSGEADRGRSTSVAGGALDALVRIEAERRPLYSEVAEVVVDVDGLPARDVAERVVELAHRTGDLSPPLGGSPRT
jgi:shikimate kinase